MAKPYVYVLVREDLAPEQQLVQASHAALEAGFRFEPPGETASLIALSVPDLAALTAAAQRLERHGIEHHLSSSRTSTWDTRRSRRARCTCRRSAT
ncbi:hypothetical protein LMG28727_07659 [Paraburkholderia kirstenboschensis]|uniref:hypothetical protein n=1 Tax=Paraburkholderia kirstenboschensis TaxID=1245436 RepID=UPI000A8F6948|nr:hypothetical protein [Paraburkholderia kirstenboschensis]CAD6562127.1 hypothetical protein LMG28727_07659 [Paraburkholderia kirstenboschensis]